MVIFSAMNICHPSKNLSMPFYSEHHLTMRMDEQRKKMEFILNINKEINWAVYGPKEKEKVLRRFVK